MRSKVIKDLLEIKFGIKDNYSNEELGSIDSITINRFDVDGSLLDFDFNELLLLTNLEELIIDNYSFSEENINIISNLNIKSLSLYDCEFVDDPSAIFNSDTKITSLVLDNTFIDLSLISNILFNYLYIANTSIDDNDVFSANVLDVSRALADNLYFVKYSEINKIIVSEKQYEDNKIILTNVSVVDIMEDNGQFVKQEVVNDG